MLNHRNTAITCLLVLAVITGLDMTLGIGPWAYIAVGVIWFILLALGSIFIQLNFYIKSYHRGRSGDQVIGLTFDDGPHPTYTPMVLDLLKSHEIKAAFFLIGSYAAEYPGLVRRIDREEHILGSHSFSHHFFFDLFPARKMWDELKQTAEAIEETTGRKIRWFRPPYGVTNPVLARVVRRFRYYSIGWSIKSRDTVSGRSAEIVNRILKMVKPGDVLLFHDNRELTAKALSQLIPALKERGFVFIRPDQLLKLDVYENE